MNTRTGHPLSVAPTKPAPAGTRQALTAIISELCEVDPAQIAADFVLASSGRLRSSLGRATLDAKIRRRLGVTIENLHTLRTFGELEAALALGQTGVTVPPLDVPLAPSTEVPQTVLPVSARSLAEILPVESGLACGIDVESVAGLPEANDYWEESFYKDNFTAAEIAYCVSQSNPRLHFAARWCAKEALKKCLPAYGRWQMNKIEVVRREAGPPYLRVLADGSTKTPPVALSLTHSEDWALALVVGGAEKPPLIRPDPSASAKESRIGIALGLAALVCALLALVLALLYRR
jgi:phosphopantetheine--protein transferase-like protein